MRKFIKRSGSKEWGKHLKGRYKKAANKRRRQVLKNIDL